MKDLTLSVKDFLCSHLHINIENYKIVEGDHILASLPIPKHLALKIFEICGNKHTAYIEFPTAISTYQDPILWDWNDWVTEEKRRRELTEKSHRDRVERFLLEANIKICAPKIASFCNIDLQDAALIAVKLIKKKNLALLSVYGVTKLKEKESEL